MTKRKVIAFSNISTPIPLQTTAVVYLLLDKIQAAGWIWGAVGCTLVLIWLVWIVGFFIEEEVDIFKK